MKYASYIIIVIVLFNICSCKKERIESKSSSVATLIVTNSIIGGDITKLNTNLRDSANIYNSKAFNLTAGSSDIMLFPINNPGTPYYNNTQETERGGVYSLFLTGQISNIDAIFVKESIPAYYIDSTIGIRVINLSYNSSPLNITLSSASSKNIFSKIEYKQLTQFIKLPLPNPVPSGSVSFQVRDASNSLLTTYDLPATANSTFPRISILNSRNRNITLVIRGVFGSSNNKDGFGIFPVANY